MSLKKHLIKNSSYNSFCGECSWLGRATNTFTGQDGPLQDWFFLQNTCSPHSLLGGLLASGAVQGSCLNHGLSHLTLYLQTLAPSSGSALQNTHLVISSHVSKSPVIFPVVVGEKPDSLARHSIPHNTTDSAFLILSEQSHLALQVAKPSYIYFLLCILCHPLVLGRTLTPTHLSLVSYSSRLHENSTSLSRPCLVISVTPTWMLKGILPLKSHSGSDQYILVIKCHLTSCWAHCTAKSQNNFSSCTRNIPDSFTPKPEPHFMCPSRPEATSWTPQAIFLSTLSPVLSLTCDTLWGHRTGTSGVLCNCLCF